MTWDAEKLYGLLPALHRIQDEQRGRPLHALTALLARELQVIEASLDQLYDDQFIETCADWVAPYIGDLIGYRPVRSDAQGSRPRLNSPRAEVANTIAYRRRKGTALMLEALARNVTDWPAHATEFFEQLATSQYMNHARLHAPATAEVRNLRRMLAVGQDHGAFNRTGHTVEVRRPEGGSGRFNVPNIGLFLWRIRPMELQELPLVPHPGDATGTKFRVNPLGFDLPMFRRPLPEDGIEQLAIAANVPARLRIRSLALQVRAAQPGIGEGVDAALNGAGSTLDYGAGRSFVFRRDGKVVPIHLPVPDPAPGNPPAAPVPALPGLRIADLRDMLDASGNVVGWAHEDGLRPQEWAVDPERGRVVLGSAQAAVQAADPLRVTFHYGTALAFGGGSYQRSPAGALHVEQRTAAAGIEWQPLLDDLHAALEAAPVDTPVAGRLLITDSQTHAGTPVLRVPGDTAAGAGGHELVIAAANGVRPVLQVGGDVVVQIGARSTLVLEGLVISGGALRLDPTADGEPRTLILRDCTLVPGLSREIDGRARSPGAPSLVLDDPNVTLVMERCITGSLHVAAQAEASLACCIIDADTPAGVAYCAPGGGAGAPLALNACTLVGQVDAMALPMVSDTLFHARSSPTTDAPVRVQRRQQGCVRFSFVPEGSITPRRHRCMPDAAHPQARPLFIALRYGDPAYGLLRATTDPAIRQGASEDGEMGVMHDLQQPLREANLRVRLDEYLRFGLSAGIFYAT